MIELPAKVWAASALLILTGTVGYDVGVKRGIRSQALTISSLREEAATVRAAALTRVTEQQAAALTRVTEQQAAALATIRERETQLLKLQNEHANNLQTLAALRSRFSADRLRGTIEADCERSPAPAPAGDASPEASTAQTLSSGPLLPITEQRLWQLADDAEAVNEGLSLCRKWMDAVK